MKTTFLIILCCLFGCSSTQWQDTSEFLDILNPPPQLICDKNTEGINWEGQKCLKWDDNSYHWTNKIWQHKDLSNVHMGD